MRRGFSLIEIMLVLALLVIVAALATPSVTRTLDGQRLRKSGDLVRVEWAKARNQAMKSGRVYVFRCKLGQDEYEVRPWYAANDLLESSTVGDATGLGNPAGGNLQPTATDTALAKPKRLPEGVQFASGETEAEGRSAEVDAAYSAESGADWGPPILFYPDGTSSTSRLLLTNGRQKFVSLDLRGLTGLAQVSDLLTQQELSP